MKRFEKKKIKTVNGTFEYSLSVKNSPAIILINGGSGPIEGWYRVFHELADEFTIMAYNRLGVGGSSKPTHPQDGTAIVTSLKQLLDDVGVSPPYILVGHSLGGLYANFFARQFPEQVTGVVLLESSHPQDLAINDTQPAPIRILNRLLSIFDVFSPSRKWDEVHFVQETAKQIEQARTFPDKPLFVVSGKKKPPFMPEHAFEIRRKNQLDFLQLSKHSKQIWASRSGHFPQLTEPDLVIQAIRECIHAD
ncbi:alpha/beta fold hydrolase [Paenibacillus tarimensis]|uniref:alpha/beta fold hydrolase n=1 Tax=Paenibacillus tarimensis TaxID=416012 RepID=UPI001F3BD201|nr:alpha/beta hydrolase [Paenibacillus tarimensis]MCF2944456.1 alpha/beta hydrolase [Paenibacillus tarimensis]